MPVVWGRDSQRESDENSHAECSQQKVQMRCLSGAVRYALQEIATYDVSAQN